MTGLYIINQDFTPYEQYENLIGLAITLDKPYGKYLVQAQKDKRINDLEFTLLVRFAYDTLQEKRSGWRDE